MNGTESNGISGCYIAFNPEFEDISCLDILSAFNIIHIFYYIENALKRAQESLIHAWLRKRQMAE
jgi:hypothetical protein